MKREEWEQKLIDEGCIDERRAFTMSNIVFAPNGEKGLSLLCVCGDSLKVYDTDFSGVPKVLLYDIPFAEMQDFKLNTFVLNSSLKFRHQGFEFIFSAGLAKKQPIAIVLKEIMS